LSDGIYELLDGNVSCICVEPTPELNKRISGKHKSCADQVHNLVSIENNAIDIVIGLAGLHHSESICETINESYRVLKPGGEFAVCDVEKGSAVADWLNDYVNENSESGHEGKFFHKGEVSTLMTNAGFANQIEKIESVPWVFDQKSDISEFFKGLFGLTSSIVDIANAIPDYLTLTMCDDKYLVDWQLIYAYGKKPQIL